ncbi:alpha/beta-hydrolase [Conidiobolus coronatus NRRL 28638]|uniref:Alpha/beta-hydrolase n=1 Tax=Conidiobolus coronatus (strain ATCC 28846 / CBS 209.66 / NRRL 28638) TaxID=796925 RepID=A0A137P6V9_CONC2|nr:alpha/beta-hydrolase [Conidiobolus coronatus NRRL 28638]|eukprot:KXN70746.1 alpha/beta-hydrolase [Conidiobolus coronatus NRRL 28638]
MQILKLLVIFYVNLVLSLSLESNNSSLSWSSITDYIKDKSVQLYNSLPSISNLNWFSAKDDTVDRTLNSTDTSSSAQASPASAITEFKFNNIPISEDSAKSYLPYASLAYCKPEVLEAWSCKLCKSSSLKDDIEYTPLYNDYYNTTGFIITNKPQKTIILSYKGSKNTVNWIMNLKSTYTNLTLDKPFENAKIHSGFHEMADSLYNQTKESLQRSIAQYPDYKIIATGHSMGGALAVLNTLQLVLDKVLTWDKVTVVTFGQPRVGNKDFVNFMDSQTTSITRVNREGDPVPTVPTPPLYYHNGFNMFIRGDNSTNLCLPTDKGEGCTSSVSEMTTKSHFSYWNFRLDSNCNS